MLGMSSVAFAADAAPDLYGYVNVEQSGDYGEVLKMGVLVSEPVVSPTGEDAKAVYDRIWSECSGADDVNSCFIKKAEEALPAGGTLPTMYSVQNAKFVVMQYNPANGKYDTQINCQGTGMEVIADQVEEITGYSGAPIQYYYGTCTVPKEYFEGRRITAQVVYVPEEGMSIAYENPVVEISDSTTSAAEIFKAAVVSAIQAFINETQATGGTATLPCIGVFLILGLLLASMYFAGKSPITLLDITSPRLPAPKGFMASGQVILPYGYGEMKRALKGKAAAGVAAMSGIAAIKASKMGHSSNMERYNKLIEESKATGDDKKVMKSLAVLAEEGKISPDKAKALFQTVPGMYGEEQHKTVAEILKALRAKGGKDAVMADVVKDYFQTVRTSQTMEVLSGQPDLTKRSKIQQSIMGKIDKYAGASRYYTAHSPFGPALGSTVRSGRVVVRGTKEMVKQAPTLARGVAKTTIEMIGGTGALEKMERAGKRGSRFAGVVSKELRKPPASLEVGQMMPIGEKMDHLYNTLRKEISRDEMKYVIKELYKAMGVKLQMAEEEIARMGYRDMDILEVSGYNKNAPAIEAMEKKLRAILTDHKLDDAARLNALVSLAESHGAKIDGAMHQFNNKLAAIEASGEAGYLKFIALNSLLEEHQNHARAAGVGQTGDDGHFYTVVGRGSLNGRDIMDTMVFRTMVYDAEEGHLLGGLKDELLSTQLNVINRTVSLHPLSNINELPEYMRNASELQALEKRVVKNFGELLTEDGKRMLAEKGKSPATATLSDYVAVGTGLAHSMKGVPRTYDKVDAQGRVAFWGAEMEFGPAQGAFKVDMKRHWVSDLDTAAQFAIGQHVNSRFTRSYVGPHDPVIEAHLDRMPGSANWTVSQRAAKAKELMVTEQLKTDMENRFNSQFCYAAYGKTPEVAKYYTGVLAGFMEKALMDRGMGEMNSELSFVKNMDLSKPADLRRLGDIVRRYEGDFQKVLSHKVSFDDIITSNKAYVMTYEGGFAFYRKGMTLSGADRVYGDVSIRDNHGQRRAFNVDDVALEFKGRPDLQRELYKALESGNPGDWKNVMNAAYKWKGEGGYDYEKEKVYGALCWRYGNNTNDMESHWAKSAVEIAPKREVMSLAPTPFRMFGVESIGAEKAMTHAKKYGESLGGYLAKVGIGAGGPVFRQSYDVTAHSEALREHSMRTAMRIYQMDIKQLSPVERDLYYKVAQEHGPYHHAWDWAIDRNPQKHSTSHGIQQAMDSYFQFGPRSNYAAKDYVRGTMTGAEWNIFRSVYGFPLDIANKLQRPYAQMFGGMQMAMQGYPSKWDMSKNPLKPWDYTPTRFGEAVRALNPLSFSWSKSSLGKIPQKLNVWEGSLEKHGLAGADIMGGHNQAPQDIFGKRTGAYAVGRTGEANPGASMYTYRNVLTIDPTQAEFLWRNREAVAVMDKEIRDQAMSYTMNRNVAAEALGIRRQQELMHFGVWQNALYGWANPLAFAYHMPLPFYPPSLSPKEIATSVARRAKMKDPGRKWGAAVGDMFRSSADASLRFMQPWKGASVAYCPKCHKGGYKGSKCSCGGMIY